ncbi:MAG: sigma-54-dependent Fis family transcriptional regulator [Deltaproteobacteria bacterium]|nr:sigma-54-dependent Fis family transcriptional regulator [Deltaproteobacteria bacterium]
MSHRILIVDDERNIRTTLARALDLEGFVVDGAENGAAGLAAIAATPPDLVLLDLKLPDIDGLTVLERLQASTAEAPPVVMMSGHGTLDAAIRATRLGAVDFLEKPVEVERLLLTVRNALKLSTLDRQVGALTKNVEQRAGMVGESRALLSVLEAVRRAAPTKARVLVTGESGVGKELVARAIHDLSRRAGGPFVKLNCAAMNETVVESELFGHEKGAFTGADRRHLGRFERADGGTLFLDEVGELPVGTQAKLLRVLQEGEFERVGGSASVKVDVRVIAATNRNLVEEARQGRFREDLYYRLNVVPLQVPPLRDRREDIPALARHLLQKSCAENDVGHKDWSDDALVALQQHDWPGNVRELVHVVDRLAILVPGDVVGGADVRAALPGAPRLEGAAIPDTGPLYALVESFEKRIIEDRIARFGGHMSRAAEDLGLERSHLYKKVRRLGIQTRE